MTSPHAPLASQDNAALIRDVMDRSPLTCHADWPVERAHNLFAAMGLRHLLVLGAPNGADHAAPVGIITRRDLASCELRTAATSHQTGGGEAAGNDGIELEQTRLATGPSKRGSIRGGATSARCGDGLFVRNSSVQLEREVSQPVP